MTTDEKIAHLEIISADLLQRCSKLETQNILLSKVFSKVWELFVDGHSFDGSDLETIFEQSGFAEWRGATIQEANDWGIDEGDALLCLNDAGKQIREKVK